MQDKELPVQHLTRIKEFESTDPEYLEWKKQKIETAIAEADDHPDNIMTEKEVWRKHGVEY